MSCVPSVSGLSILDWPSVFSRVTRPLVLCVLFVYHCLSLIVLFVLAIMLSVLRFSDSNYTFGIFKSLLFSNVFSTKMGNTEPIKIQV
jgi:hypothetical protein